MALDEPNEADEVFEKNGLTFLMEKKLLEESKPVTVDYINSPQGEGFVISSGAKKESSDCGGCTSC
jgi:iron-sulfur cluster assembly protein